MEAEAARSQLGGKDESVFFGHPAVRAVSRFLEMEGFAERYHYKLAAYAEDVLEVRPVNPEALTAFVLLLGAYAPAEVLMVLSVDVRTEAYRWLHKRCQPKVEKDA